MDTLQIHRRHRSWLRRKLTEPFDGPTVVVTHHAPHRKSLASRYAEDWSSGGFVNEMRPEFFKVPVLWVHGHTHGSFDYEVDDCREISNPRGYLNWHGEFENKVFNPGLVVEVDSSPAVNGVRLDKELLKLARQAFGEGAHAWLGQPHVLLGGPNAGRVRCRRRSRTSAVHSANDPARRRCMRRAAAGLQSRNDSVWLYLVS